MDDIWIIGCQQKNYTVKYNKYKIFFSRKIFFFKLAHSGFQPNFHTSSPVATAMQWSAKLIVVLCFLWLILVYLNITYSYPMNLFRQHGTYIIVNAAFTSETIKFFTTKKKYLKVWNISKKSRNNVKYAEKKNSLLSIHHELFTSFFSLTKFS